jgi:hypothetical protein
MVNQVIEIKLVDLAGVETDEAGTHVLQQAPQLLLVIGADQLSRCLTLSLIR